MALSQRLALHASRAGRKARSTRVLEALVADAAASAAASVQQPTNAKEAKMSIDNNYAGLTDLLSQVNGGAAPAAPAALVIGDDPGQYTEADIRGYYHLVTARINDNVVAFATYPSAKLVGGKLVPITAAEGERVVLGGAR